jgi:hypothetical protein
MGAFFQVNPHHPEYFFLFIGKTDDAMSFVLGNDLYRNCMNKNPGSCGYLHDIIVERFNG